MTTTLQPPQQQPQTGTSNFELEDFFLTKLSLEYVAPQNAGQQPTELNCGFSASLGDHKEQKHRYRVIFGVKAFESTNDGVPVGKQLEAQISGFFCGSPSEPAKARETRMMLNGISVLYGLLRGIVATNSGCFPGGKLVLPVISPQEILQQIAKDNTLKETKGTKPKKIIKALA